MPWRCPGDPRPLCYGEAQGVCASEATILWRGPGGLWVRGHGEAQGVCASEATRPWRGPGGLCIWVQIIPVPLGEAEVG